MECGVKDNDLRNIRQNLAACPQCQCVTMVVYRCQFPQLVDLLDDLVCYHGGLGENFCALYDTVANGGNFAHAGDHSALASGQRLNQTLKSLCVGRECAVLFNLDAAGSLVAQVAVDADAVAVSLGDDRLILHIDELVLQGGAAGVYNKNNHRGISPFLML